MFEKWKQIFGRIEYLEKDVQLIRKTAQESEVRLDRKIEQIYAQMASDDGTTNAIISDIVELKRQILTMGHRAGEKGLGDFTSNQLNMLNKVTNSQAGEDCILAYIVAVLGIPFEKCTYLDLGANHPIEMSNTYFFYSLGASGVLVEANKALIPELQIYRQKDIIVNKCVAEKSGGKVKFNVLNIDGLSFPGDISVDELKRENPDIRIEAVEEIETISVNDLMEKYFPESPIIMNVDIEGREMEILTSISWEKYRPFLIIVEVIPYSPKLIVGIKNQEIIDYLGAQGYCEYAFTGINSIFIDVRQVEKYKFKI